MEQEEQLQQEGAENEEDEENPEFNADDLVDSDVDTPLAMVVRLSLPQRLRSKIGREQPSFKHLSPAAKNYGSWSLMVGVA